MGDGMRFSAALVLASTFWPLAAAGCLNGQTRAYRRTSYAQITLGCLGCLGCLSVLAVIFGHNRDRRCLRDRILAGMFVSNLVFSAGYLVPYLNRCPDTVPLAGDSVAIGIIISGKYMMVTYELFIVGASVVALRTGATSSESGPSAPVTAFASAPGLPSSPRGSPCRSRGWPTLRTQRGKPKILPMP